MGGLYIIVIYNMTDINQELYQMLSVALGKACPARHLRNVHRAFVEDLGRDEWQEAIDRLTRGMPLQYVTGYTYFYGLKLKVTPDVLIPRPETETLVEEVIKRSKKEGPILDIGTGSGCVSIALARETDAEIWACDISPDALEVAKENAREIGVSVNFMAADVCNIRAFDRCPTLNLIVSNPPYITQDERSVMTADVLEHEPHAALFVPQSESSTFFYERIIELAKGKLKRKGFIVVEMNEFKVSDIRRVFEESPFSNIEIVNDLDGRQRVLIASRF